jgi:hypothetical protein
MPPPIPTRLTRLNSPHNSLPIPLITTHQRDLPINFPQHRQITQLVITIPNLTNELPFAAEKPVINQPLQFLIHSNHSFVAISKALAIRFLETSGDKKTASTDCLSAYGHAQAEAGNVHNQ